MQRKLRIIVIIIASVVPANITTRHVSIYWHRNSHYSITAYMQHMPCVLIEI